MNAKEFAKLKVGDKVRIVDKRSEGRGCWNNDGKMDKWLGKVMTVRAIGYKHVDMVEDKDDGFAGDGWAWFDHMIAEKIESGQVREITREAKVGEWIKIVDANNTYECYKNGDILKVYRVYPFSESVLCEMHKKLNKKQRENVANDKGNILIGRDEYVVLEGYEPDEEKVEEKTEPKKEPPKFKVGDKVKYLGGGDGQRGLEIYYPPIGTIGTIVNLDPVGDPMHCIQWPKGSTSDDDSWYCSEKELELYEEPVHIVEHLIKDRKTIVKLSNGKVGVAVCSPDDEFDICEGLRLAAERAYGRTEAYKKPEPVKEVKRKAKVGEWIKTVDCVSIGEPYKNGDIFKVKERITCPDSVRAECRGVRQRWI